MRRILGTTTVAVAAFAVFGTTVVAQDAKVEQGKQLFVAQKCTLCHAAEGKGNKKGPLDEAGTKLSAAEIKQWIVDPKGMTAKTKATRKPPMKAYPNLSPADVDALVAYVSSLKKK